MYDKIEKLFLNFRTIPDSKGKYLMSQENVNITLLKFLPHTYIERDVQIAEDCKILTQETVGNREKDLTAI